MLAIVSLEPDRKDPGLSAKVAQLLALLSLNVYQTPGRTWSSSGISTNFHIIERNFLEETATLEGSLHDIKSKLNSPLKSYP